MASLQERNGSFRVQFFLHGKLHGFTIGKVTKAEAQAKAAQVDYLLMRLKQKLLTLPPGADIVAFVQHDGTLPPSHTTPEAPRREVTLGVLKDRYLTTHANGTVEASSLATSAIHFGHLCRAFGDALPLTGLTLADVQGYVNKRKVAAVTVKKEVATFRAARNWGSQMGLTSGVFPSKGLRYPKTDEKPPFMTVAEVKRQIAAGGDKKVLWECVYLTADELPKLLARVRESAAYPWVYPLYCFAAHTGARRSELLRALVADVDFTAGVVTIREKKRTRGQRTSRRVPLTDLLRGVMEEWLKEHPGSPNLFCHAGVVARSKKRSRTTGHRGEASRASSLKGRQAGVRDRAAPPPGSLTRNEIHHHFRTALKGTEWDGVPGLHALRHSFISACASKGVDQRLIDEWTGHSTEEQRKRYRHLYPSTQAEAIKGVFG
ncbi:MAG TPA: tyrosine-type recombinase/integrase [Urbifossiella sp.]|nr:tyrosine-type recombinase/integrase [Urbifossiella sp.]